MPGDDQERFEDYLELERFIEGLQAGHAVSPPQDLTPAQARVYRMAMLFHSATPGADEPTPQFVEQLRERLEAELQSRQKDGQQTHTPPLQLAPPAPRPRRLSRRLLLTGGATAAASLAVGASAEYMVEQAMQNEGSQDVTIKVSSPREWFVVTTVAQVGNQAVKFRTVNPDGSTSLTGYVVRNDGTDNPAEKGKIIAVSAACTHMGCIVQWSGSDRKFHCPCHGGIFTEDGGIDTTASALVYLNPLPRLEVSVDDSSGQIKVRMPAGRW
jgi:Rieske Fe-S protein